jgi:hypothetical protein
MIEEFETFQLPLFNDDETIIGLYSIKYTNGISELGALTRVWLERLKSNPTVVSITKIQ